MRESEKSPDIIEEKFDELRRLHTKQDYLTKEQINNAVLSFTEEREGENLLGLLDQNHLL